VQAQSPEVLRIVSYQLIIGVHSVRNAVIHCSAIPSIPTAILSLHSNISWSMQSSAALKSEIQAMSHDDYLLLAVNLI